MSDQTTAAGADPFFQALEQVAGPDGFYKPIGASHSALFVPKGKTLVVTFENLDHVRDNNDSRLPWGFDFVTSHDWSILGLMAHDWTWYRDADVYEFFDQLRADGFFEQFSQVVFYGASMGGYAAAAFSACLPGATVIAISPQATLDPETASWETRYAKGRSRDFTGPYGYAPDSLTTAKRAYILWDPAEDLDAKHAALFGNSPTIVPLHCRWMGHRIASAMIQMAILKPIILSAVEGRLTPQSFYTALRARRDSPRYLKGVKARAEARGQPWLVALLCEYYLKRWRGPAFARARRDALAELETKGLCPPSKGWPGKEQSHISRDTPVFSRRDMTRARRFGDFGPLFDAPFPAEWSTPYDLPDDAWSDGKRRPQKKYLDRARNLRRCFNRIQLFLPELLHLPPQKVLELSTAHGGMLEVLRSYGHEVLGNDYLNMVSPQEGDGARALFRNLNDQTFERQVDDYNFDIPENGRIRDWPYRPIVQSINLPMNLFDAGRTPYPLASDSFDYVLCLQAIEHYCHPKDWLKVVDEMCRISRKSIFLLLNPMIDDLKSDAEYARDYEATRLALRDYDANGFHCISTHVHWGEVTGFKLWKAA